MEINNNTRLNELIDFSKSDENIEEQINRFYMELDNFKQHVGCLEITAFLYELPKILEDKKIWDFSSECVLIMNYNSLNNNIEFKIRNKSPEFVKLKSKKDFSNIIQDLDEIIADYIEENVFLSKAIMAFCLDKKDNQFNVVFNKNNIEEKMIFTEKFLTSSIDKKYNGELEYILLNKSKNNLKKKNNKLSVL